jgi:hypothetical protein
VTVGRVEVAERVGAVLNIAVATAAVLVYRPKYNGPLLSVQIAVG